jgi:hypothetical protein
MEFVEDDGGHALEERVRLQARQQDPLCHHHEAGGRPGAVVEAHLVANLLSQGGASFRRDAMRGRAGSDPARLHHPHLAWQGVEQRGRHPGGLSGAGRGSQRDRTPPGPGDDFVNHGIDGKVVVRGGSFDRQN